MIRLAGLDVWVGWSGAEAFDYAKLAATDSVLEDLATHEADLVFWVGPS